MHDLPGGTITLLFTDIEGSTRLLHELGEDYAEVLSEHRSALRAAFTEHRGREVDTQGDAFFVAFERASDAIAAAVASQRALTRGVVLVRMGIHTGEPTRTEEGYVGVDVHRAARICAAGHGGQVLVSQTTRELLTDVDVRDLGEHRLKDLTAPQRLYQLLIDGLRAEFPALKTLDNRPTNLPVEPTPLIGREPEVEDLSELLEREDVRLLTLTGSGGTGKTRLALQAAAELIDHFRDGVFFVPLASISDAGLVLPTIAQTLGLRQRAGQTSAETLTEYLREKQMLLLVDNFEQVLGAAPALAELTSAAPDVKLLVTSRAPVHLSGEQEYPLWGLPEPDASALFAQRARAVKPDFEPDGAVSAICRRLDGLPLALELAAARVKVLSPEELLARLERSLELLTGGARDLPARQQTLRATIDWSYRLLKKQEQTLFARMAVFVGGCRLETAEQVCAADLDTLGTLVDNSLLRRDGDRFVMLETVREYALERLNASAEQEEFSERHAEHYASVAERTEEASASPDHAALIEKLDADHENCRAALNWALGRDDSDLTLRLLWGLWRFWLIRGHGREGWWWGEQVLGRKIAAPRLVHARGLLAASELARFRGHLEKAVALKVECIERMRELGESNSVGALLHDLCEIAVEQGQYARAKALGEQSLAVRREIGNERSIAHSLHGLGSAELVLGNVARAKELFEDVLAAFRQEGPAWWIATALASLGEAERRLGEQAAAMEHLGESLRLFMELRDESSIAECLESFSALAVAGNDAERAARISATAEALWKKTDMAPWDPAENERNRALLRSTLDEPALTAAWAEGHAMTIEEAVAYALEESKGIEVGAPKVHNHGAQEASQEAAPEAPGPGQETHAQSARPPSS